jgi:hypothetical protein
MDGRLPGCSIIKLVPASKAVLTVSLISTLTIRYIPDRLEISGINPPLITIR